MKKKIRYMALLAVLFLAGCAKAKPDGMPYQVYVTNQQYSRLKTENYTGQDAEALALLDGLLEQIKTPSAVTDDYSVIPQEVEITDYNLTDGQLTVTFNPAYLQMDTAQEVLLRAGLVLTVSQVPDVRTVVFHIENDVLRDAAGEPVGAMTSSMFINTPVGMNSYQYASLSLYFSNREGDRIIREVRNVHYSSNTTLEKVVAEQLVKGPRSDQLLPILPEDVSVLDISVNQEDCTINLSKEFLNVRDDESLSPEVTIYGIVNSLCDVLNVKRVQFQVEGQSNVLYKESLSLSGPFHRNSELIEVVENLVAQPVENVVQPSVGL